MLTAPASNDHGTLDGTCAMVPQFAPSTVDTPADGDAAQRDGGVDVGEFAAPVLAAVAAVA